MIVILNQRKNNIKKCNDLLVTQNDNKFCVCVVLNNDSVGGMSSRILGTYATEKRAKEVVMEIWGRIGQGLCIQRYEMPKE